MRIRFSAAIRRETGCDSVCGLAFGGLAIPPFLVAALGKPGGPDAKVIKHALVEDAAAVSDLTINCEDGALAGFCPYAISRGLAARTPLPSAKVEPRQAASAPPRIRAREDLKRHSALSRARFAAPPGGTATPSGPCCPSSMERGCGPARRCACRSAMSIPRTLRRRHGTRSSSRSAPFSGALACRCAAGLRCALLGTPNATGDCFGSSREPGWNAGLPYRGCGSILRPGPLGHPCPPAITASRSGPGSSP